MKVTQTIDVAIVCSVCGKDVEITQVDIDEAYVTPCDCITLEVERVTTRRIEQKLKTSVGLLTIILDDYPEEVECPGCSEAGGADRAVYHLPPICKI